MSKRYRSQPEGASTASIGNTLNIKWFYVLHVIWIHIYNIYDKWIHKYMGEKHKIFLIECQLINEEGMLEIDNHSLTTISEKAITKREIVNLRRRDLVVNKMTRRSRLTLWKWDIVARQLLPDKTHWEVHSIGSAIPCSGVSAKNVWPEWKKRQQSYATE